MLKPGYFLQLSLRDLFWLVFVAAVFTLWGMDRSRLTARIDSLEKPKQIASPYYQFDDVQYFPPGPEFILSSEIAAQKVYRAEEEAANR